MRHQLRAILKDDSFLVREPFIVACPIKNNAFLATYAYNFPMSDTKSFATFT